MEHCDTRWLTLGPGCERGSEQLPAIREYFLVFLPKKNPKISKNYYYKIIAGFLENPFLEVTLKFITHWAKIFTKTFTEFMQRQEPLVHLIYARLEKLIMLVVAAIIKPTLRISDKKTFTLDAKLFREDKIQITLKDSSYILPLKDCNFGHEVDLILNKLSTSDQNVIRIEFKNFLKGALLHIDSRITDKQLMRYLGSLSPDRIKDSGSHKHIVFIAKKLPLYDVDYDALSCEWQLLQFDDEVNFKLKEKERLDDYWSRIFSLMEGSSRSRYPLINRVVKVALSLPHGSADVETAFSESKWQLPQDRASMSLRVLDARQTISDVLKNRFDNCPHKVPITDKLLDLGRTAHNRYRSYMEAEKEKDDQRKKDEVEAAALQTKEQEDYRQITLKVKDLENLKESLKKAQASHSEAEKNVKSIEVILET